MKRLGRILLDPAPTDGNGNNDNAAAVGIEKARLEERKKLSDQLTTLTTAVETFKGQIATLTADKQSLAKELSDLKTAYEALKAGSKPDGGLDVEKAIQTAVNAALSKQGPVLQQEIANLRAELDQERQKRQTAELAQIRARIVEELGGSSVLIPELVSGNTEEELRQSAEKSKSIMERSLAAAGARLGSSGGGSGTGNGAGNSGPSSVPLGNASSGGGAPNASQGNKSSLLPGGRIKLADYASNREKLKADALARASGN